MGGQSPLFTALGGIWHGRGHGEFPTMDAFDYDEEIRFTDVGAPSLHYLQRGWEVDSGELLHSETGIWRAYPDGRLAVTIALPRVAEVSEGRYADGSISLASTSVRRASGGAALVAVQRQYRINGDRIDYDIAMATEEVPKSVQHLAGHLERIAVLDAAMLGQIKPVSSQY